MYLLSTDERQTRFLCGFLILLTVTKVVKLQAKAPKSFVLDEFDFIRSQNYNFNSSQLSRHFPPILRVNPVSISRITCTSTPPDVYAINTIIDQLQWPSYDFYLYELQVLPQQQDYKVVKRLHKCRTRDAPQFHTRFVHPRSVSVRSNKITIDPQRQQFSYQTTSRVPRQCTAFHDIFT